MSWLSTLGGAFSSLGNDVLKFAHIAEKISTHQLKLALMIGDPIIISRCKLYYCIALIQKGQLKKAKRIIKKEYDFALTQIENDHKLYKMSVGIYNMLKYFMIQKEITLK